MMVSVLSESPQSGVRLYMGAQIHGLTQVLGQNQKDVAKACFFEKMSIKKTAEP